MWLVLQATVLVVCLSSAEHTSLCRGTDAERQGCTCSYVDGYTKVTCTSLPVLVDLPALTRSLDLSRNDIVSLPPDIFAGLPLIEDLVLSWNSVSSISENALRNLTDLRTLDLSHNLLSILPPGLLDAVPRLQKLDVSFNRLTTLDDATFQNVPNLTELSLSYNKHLGPFLQNSFESMTPIFRSKLRTLSLDHVGLVNLPINFFTGANRLHELSLADNPLEMIPDLPRNLEILDMSGCLLRKLFQFGFVMAAFLRVLKLDRAQELVEVHVNAFAGLSWLEELSMQGCANLRSVSGGAFGDEMVMWCKPQKLSLTQNGLTTLPKELLGPLSSVKRLDLQGNPWDCDCHLNWLLRLNFSPSVADDLRCATPNDLHDVKVMSLTDDAFLCDLRWQRPVLALVGLAILLWATFVGSARLKRRLLRWRGGFAKAPGYYKVLRMDGATDDYEADMWSTKASAKFPQSP